MVHCPPSRPHRRGPVHSILVLVLLGALTGCTVISGDAYNARLEQGGVGTVTGDGGTVLDGGTITDGGTPTGDAGTTTDTGCDPVTWYADVDSDGLGDPAVTTDACDAPTGYVDNGDDCDDSDASVLGATTFYGDVDGDGFGSATDTVDACTLPKGYVAALGDCDDSDAAVNPDAVETCATTADDNCDGQTNVRDAAACIDYFPDYDGDGYGVVAGSECWCQSPAGFAASPEDCDDSDGSVNPAADEVCLDGIDNNCDGVGCQLTGTWADSDADSTLSGSGGVGAGDAVALLGDLDGDGRADLGVAAPFYQDAGTESGAMWVVLGPASGTVDLATDSDGFQVGVASGDRAGRALSGLADVNGDGYPEILLSAPSSDSSATDGGAVYVVFGPATGVHSLADADRILAGGTSYLYAGSAMIGLDDATGDGVPDMLVGAPNDGTGGTAAGAAYLLAGPFDGTGGLQADAVATIIGEAANNSAGYALGRAGDLDGDGLADMVIGAYLNDDAATNAGAAYVVLGGIDGVVSLADSQAQFYGSNASDGAGKAVAGAGDVNGDGASDLLIGADGNDGGGAASGAAYVVYGPFSGASSLTDADITLLGENAGDLAGVALAMAGDLDGDGATEILIGAPGSDRSVTNGGAAYLFYDPPVGTSSLGDAAVIIEGSDSGLGSALAGGQDIDGDGTPDMVIASPDVAGGDGQVLIFLGAGL
ncbi:MAG: hypothetical protein GXP62_11860 [Oligoflexia bacterium]|nr:hypothetical protein [Oligoflexia bacterium]